MVIVMEYTTRKAYKDSSLNCSQPRCLVSLPSQTSPTLLILPSACIASIVKLTLIPSYGRSGDFLYDSAGLTIWTTTEVNVGILAASIPCLKPLYRILREKSGYGQRSPNNMPHFSYVMTNQEGRSNGRYRDDGQTDVGESELNTQTSTDTDLTKPTRVHVNVVRKENSPRVDGPDIGAD